MSPAALPYAALHGLALTGQLVILAPGTVDGEPCCAFMALPLRPESSSFKIAHSEDQDVRFGQIIGATRAVREHYRTAGFNPA